MNLESLNPSQKEPFKRSDLLTVLCVLTFIGSGLAAFSNLFIFLSFEEMLTIVDEYEVEIPGFDMMMSGGRRFFITGFILYTFSWVGALQMWKLRKIGFHLYTGAQLFILILPVAMIVSYQFSIFSLLFTATFIAGYAINLKFMK
ncbi:MAG: hypothetical protein K8R74_02910 [Bacteroidales bacterium]|nr:hypothetical protein [Bacteroidales bacterium]